MAWTIDAMGTPTFGVGELTVPVVAGITAGKDLFLLTFARPLTENPGTWPEDIGDDWVRLAGDLVASSLDMALYWKKAVGGEGAVVVEDSTGGGVAVGGVMFRASGGPASGLTADVVAHEESGSEVVDADTPALDIENANEMILFFVMRSWNLDSAGVTSWSNGATTLLAAGSAMGFQESSITIGVIIQSIPTDVPAGTIDFVSDLGLRNSVMAVALSPAVIAAVSRRNDLQSGGMNNLSGGFNG